jgi:hypothetical protein
MIWIKKPVFNAYATLFATTPKRFYFTMSIPMQQRTFTAFLFFGMIPSLVSVDMYPSYRASSAKKHGTLAQIMVYQYPLNAGLFTMVTVTAIQAYFTRRKSRRVRAAEKELDLCLTEYQDAVRDSEKFQCQFNESFENYKAAQENQIAALKTLNSFAEDHINRVKKYTLLRSNRLNIDFEELIGQEFANDTLSLRDYLRRMKRFDSFALLEDDMQLAGFASKRRELHKAYEEAQVKQYASSSDMCEARRVLDESEEAIGEKRRAVERASAHMRAIISPTWLDRIIQFSYLDWIAGAVVMYYFGNKVSGIRS